VHNVIERCISAGRHYTGLWVSYFFVDRAPCEGLHTIYESQRSIQGIFSGGKSSACQIEYILSTCA
jgi:hypothetical protein